MTVTPKPITPESKSSSVFTSLPAGVGVHSFTGRGGGGDACRVQGCLTVSV